MARGSIFKRCSCRDGTGKKLGAKCPELRRPTGGWAPGHGWWGYQLELPAAPGQRRRQLRRNGFDTREAAGAELGDVTALLALARDDRAIAVEIATLLAKVKAGSSLPDPKVVARRVRAGIPAAATTSLGDYLDDWHAARRGVAEGTLRAYGGHITHHLQPHLGHLLIEQLRVTHIRAMFDAITDRNTAIEVARRSDDLEIQASVTGLRTIGPATMHRIRATLRKALNDAIRHRLIEFNPAAYVELPSGKRPKARVWTASAVERWMATGQRPSPVMVWIPSQAAQFLDYAEEREPDLYAMFVFILHRGPRRGEVVGLLDCNIDLDNAAAVISQQITTCGYTPITKKVKSEAGDRVIRLDSFTVAALRAYRARRAGWQLVAGSTWPDTGLFFVQPNGDAWHPEMVSNRFERLVAESGLPPIRLHDLRHCAATYLKAAGADIKDIQELLGHSSATITSDTYTSVIAELSTEHAKAQAAADLIHRNRRAA